MSMLPTRDNAMSHLAAMSANANGGQMLTKREAAYQEQSADPTQSCGQCVHFDGVDSCEVVAGRINPAGVSNQFEPKSQNPVPGSQVPPGGAMPA